MARDGTEGLADGTGDPQAVVDRPGVAHQGRTGDLDTQDDPGGSDFTTDRVPDELVAAAGEGLVHPNQSPLFHAENAARYDRQALIAAYEGTFKCRLVVMFDVILAYSISLFEELIYDADPTEDLHVLLATPGGDGESAVRLARSAQARCSRLTVIVPDQAKSAGTIFALGAHHILMGPSSDLGPIDPQLNTADGQNLISAKDLIAAVDNAERAVQERPDTYPIHASLLADVTALMVQQARSALGRSNDLMHEAVRSNPDRSESDVESLCAKLEAPLITDPKSHGAILGASQAASFGLPVIEAEPTSDQWRLVWRLWTKYMALGERIYEGNRASKIMGRWSPSD